jgi:hypothetical protein
MPPLWKQTVIPKPHLRPWIRRAIPLLTLGSSLVPIAASRMPHRLAQRHLDTVDKVFLGVFTDLDLAGLPVEDGLDDAEGVVDGVFGGDD